ncbi:hypothetical protein C7974DRAFT_469152 [Boeremia exigua]|uniref:uncharacterized protein n=1 Tax=Boeremia exigua TaxID=749465 RepID=UPI001E8E9461|nr:uncharacterized protein C7974DRAFT_469152 [Boeremia exigua]KAH6642909.1 hypothetical protein C7974DRAFT_469152 [Boeremia exigua]
MTNEYAPEAAGGIDSDEQNGAPQDQNMDNEEDDFRPRVPTRAVTGLDTTPVIQKFLRDEFHPEHWDACAKTAQKLIKRKLEGTRDRNDEEMQVMVTFRAKKEKSLEEKLKMRNLERSVMGEEEYGSGTDILRDVKDLAGVRVVLYTPNKAQREKVKEVIQEIWGPNVEEKHHGDHISEAAAKANEEGGEYVRRHLGYQAVHYRVLMKKDQGKGSYVWKEDDMVEIQVVSALGHAWAEAGHDILYKTHAYGRPPTEERRILDALNGLIISGDLLLEQFRESVTKRTVAKWHQFEPFVMFLRDSDVLEQKVDDQGCELRSGYWKDFNYEGKDFDGKELLYRFLVRTKRNYPLAVRNALRDLGYPDDPRVGLESELASYEPAIRPPPGLLAPFCLISKMLRDVLHDSDQAEELLDTDYTTTKKCSLMMDALIWLQTFVGNPEDARALLLQLNLTEGDYGQRDSLDFVLRSPHRRSCFGGPLATPPAQWIDREMQAAWDWFVEQSHKDDSLCGFFFRLAIMGVPAKVVDAHERLDILKILCLSRSNTMEDPYLSAQGSPTKLM